MVVTPLQVIQHGNLKAMVEELSKQAVKFRQKAELAWHNAVFFENSAKEWPAKFRQKAELAWDNAVLLEDAAKQSEEQADRAVHLLAEFEEMIAQGPPPATPRP